MEGLQSSEGLAILAQFAEIYSDMQAVGVEGVEEPSLRGMFAVASRMVEGLRSGADSG